MVEWLLQLGADYHTATYFRESQGNISALQLAIQQVVDAKIGALEVLLCIAANWRG